MLVLGVTDAVIELVAVTDAVTELDAVEERDTDGVMVTLGVTEGVMEGLGVYEAETDDVLVSDAETEGVTLGVRVCVGVILHATRADTKRRQAVVAPPAVNARISSTSSTHELEGEGDTLGHTAQMKSIMP